jgi:hypothetical protein
MSYQNNNSNNMDNMDNMEFYKNEDDEIRPPDEVKRERLIDNNGWTQLPMKSHEELEIEEAIRLSNAAMDTYEEEQIQKLINEVHSKKNKFKNINFIFKRVSKFDKEVAEIYEIVEHAIDKYIVGDIQTYGWDKETYERIFKTIKKINE